MSESDQTTLEDRLFRARMKLTALAYMLGEMAPESSPDGPVFHGLGMVLADIGDTLVYDEVGRHVAPAQSVIQERPAGNWDTNTTQGGAR